MHVNDEKFFTQLAFVSEFTKEQDINLYRYWQSGLWTAQL